MTRRDDEIPDELLEGLPEETADAADEDILETIVADDGVSFPYGKPGAEALGAATAPPHAGAAPTGPSPPPGPQWGTSDALAGVRQSVMTFLQTAEQRLADADARLAAAKKDLARAESDRAKQLAAIQDMLQKLGLPPGPG